MLNDKQDKLPPHSPEAERGALGCVLRAWSDLEPKAAAVEGDALLIQLRTALFYDTACRSLHDELVKMRFDGHALILGAVIPIIRDRKKLEECGGFEGVAALPDCTPSIANFPEYLRILKEKYEMRFHLQRAVRMMQTIHESPNIESVRSMADETWELEKRHAQAASKLVEWLTTKESMNYKVNPNSFLVGDDIIVKGNLTVIAGKGGLGKSMLGTALAIALAKGHGTWMGYPVKTKTRTAILQSENSVLRIQKELTSGAGIPEDCYDSILWSKPTALDFGNPKFRAELTQLYERWPFGLLILDNWLDISRAEGQEDYLTALANVRSCLPMDEDGPAIVMLAHLRKTRGGETWRPKVGRALMDEISGSMALASKARTVLVLQPTHDDNDGQVVFCLAKCNDAGDADFTPSCWIRQPCEFKPVPNWDMQAWLNPPEDDGKKVMTKEIMQAVFMDGRKAMARHVAVQELVQRGFASQTAYRALANNGKFAANLVEADGLLKWVEV